MALHLSFPSSPHVILDPGVRWFPADEALRASTGLQKIAVKVVDIFGNDTMKIVEVKI